jgi:hypothetical protein
MKNYVFFFFFWVAGKSRKSRLANKQQHYKIKVFITMKQRHANKNGKEYANKVQPAPQNSFCLFTNTLAHTQTQSHI